MNNVTDPNINRDEHIEENVDAKRVVNYGMNNINQLARIPVPFLDTAFDYIGWSSPDTNGNYQTMILKQGGSSGTTVHTVNFTYDANSNITSITRS